MQADSESTQSSGEAVWRFGSFVLWESQRRLERHGHEVRMGSRSFGLLLQLVKRAGEVISNEDFLATVWSGVVVEEASVRVHMSNLRKALGQPEPGDGCHEWIANVPLRGYRFVGRVDCRDAAALHSIAPAAQGPGELPRIPARLSRLIGRDAEVERLVQVLATRRLVTIVGPGGIGKTSVAIHVAETCLAQASGLAGFVDLSAVSASQDMPGAMARALRTAPDATDPLRPLIERLDGQDVLLLLDNCEHVIERLTPVVIRLLAALPRLRILATSREALRVDGEHVLRLPALAIADEDPASLAEAMRSPAIELLVERAQATGATSFDEGDRAALVSICRQVDGVPLAIELVAARLGVQRVHEMADLLDDPMRLHWSGSRAAIARHRSLAAALDWSVALLGEAELRLFRRLSVFEGRFDVGSALSVAPRDMDPDVAMDALFSLATKSLVAFDADHADAPYCLLGITRSYARLLLLQETQRGAGPRIRAASTTGTNLQAWGSTAGRPEHKGPMEQARALYRLAVDLGRAQGARRWERQSTFAFAD